MPSHPLPVALGARARATRGLIAEPTGMSFWTDAAILAGAGIPSVLFGPGGAGLHSREEYVNVDDVRVCRDVLVETVRERSRRPAFRPDALSSASTTSL